MLLSAPLAKGPLYCIYYLNVLANVNEREHDIFSGELRPGTPISGAYFSITSTYVSLQCYTTWTPNHHQRINSSLNHKINFWSCPLINFVLMTSLIMALWKTKWQKVAVKIDLDDCLRNFSTYESLGSHLADRSIDILNDSATKCMKLGVILT